MCVRIAIYIPTSIIFLLNTSQISYLLSLDGYFRLINYNSGKKASACIHHIALAALQIVIIIKMFAY
jgi:hypothetical protein